MQLEPVTGLKSSIITVRQHQRFVGVDTLDDANVRSCPERQLNAFSLEQVQKMVIFHMHFVDTRLNQCI